MGSRRVADFGDPNATAGTPGQPVTGHRRDEQMVERELGVLVETGHLVHVEAATSGDHDRLGEERPAECEEALDDFAHRKPRLGTQPPVVGRDLRRVGEPPRPLFGFHRVEMLDEGKCELTPQIPKRLAIRVGQDGTPRTLGRGGRSAAIYLSESGRSQAAEPEVRSLVPVGRQEALDRFAGEAPVATRRREDPKTTIVRPATKGALGDPKEAAGLPEAQPPWA